ncbi:MAG: M20/M25/M40 family metallo-hydrolase [Bacteroidales bacterium]|nr:M20/M25/M40 family metallo-hydrolase [Bacteroidales bacterium]
MKIKILYLLTVSIIILASCTQHDFDHKDITIPELQEHIDYLASDELKGRFPGTEGDIRSAEYIRDALESFGLKPAVNDGLQEFEIRAKVEAGKNNELKINGRAVSPGYFTPLAFSGSDSLKSNVVFAGYGFDIESDTLTWKDYDNIDVEGKWVMILRADPEIDNASSHFARVSADRDKVMLAKDKGAAGVLLVSGESFDSADEFESLARNEYSTGIPVFRIKRNVANSILDEKNVSISKLEEKLNKTYSPASFELDLIAEGIAELTEQRLTTHNVLMTLPGNDPVLKEEYVIIGGHYDHLGMGGQGSSSRAQDTVAVHYGADDNASGIASMLEIAERFAYTKGNARSIIFAGFGAEEMGLLGSKYLADNMPVEPESINAMINLDMVGRFKESRVLQVGGVGTSDRFRHIIAEYADTSVFSLSLSEEGYGPSDHSSFYGKDIPVLFFSTGAHLDYHTPYDKADRINYAGLVQISELVYDISEELAGSNEKLIFSEAGPDAPGGRAMRGRGVTLGIMPDFAGEVKNGLRADFVSPGRPAALGGMIKGDIITGINGKPVNNIQDYMFRLSKLQAGETIQVEILRDDKKELLLIAL